MNQVNYRLPSSTLKKWMLAGLLLLAVIDAASVGTVIWLGFSSDYESRMLTAYVGAAGAIVQILICVVLSIVAIKNQQKTWFVFFVLHTLASIAFFVLAELGVFAA